MIIIKVSIITVSYNAARTIEQTIQSVVNQTYDNIEYIIIDGGSTDGTVDIIKKYEDKIAYWISEPDNGMYDALVKGFKHVTGDICAYINADDFYQKYAFEIINEIFQDKEVNWITGINTTYNDKGQIIDCKIPYKYRKRFIHKGMYNGRYLRYIQQESTFWRKELMENVDFEKLKTFKLAGDYYLWYCFSMKYELEIIMTVLSGFRLLEGQLSENSSEYEYEIRKICSKEANLFDVMRAYIDKFCGGFPTRFNNKIIKYKNGCWGNNEFKN